MDAPPRNWWSLPKPPSSRDLRQNFLDEKPVRRPSSAVKPTGFKSFATAIGLKSSKKQTAQPAFVIQDPPSPLDFPASPNPDLPQPPQSATSSRSRVDSFEPPTPVDSNAERRQSLLTLADDPFAGRPPMIAVPAHHPPTDPNRLSAYSNPSVTELVHRKPDAPTFNRVSYASSSSNSHNNGLELPPTAIHNSPKTFSEGKKLRNKRSAGSLQAKMPENLIRQTSITPSLARWGSSENQPADDFASRRPKTRARGMTDGGLPQKAGFFVQERGPKRKPSQASTSSVLPPISTTTVDSPRVIVRQASSTRLQAPPTAPPTHSLPATPYHEDLPDPRQRKGLESLPASASSSSVSLADEYVTATFALFDDKRGSQRSLFSHSAQESIFESFEPPPRDSKTAPSSPRTLKKALSHSSLKRGSSPHSSKTASDQPSDKRKQRSFQHPRLPVPPIPLSIRTSSSSGSSPFPSKADPTSPSSSADQRRASTASTGRKRLFSNSSLTRPSTSQCLPQTSPREDDSLSLFSLRSDPPDTSYVPYKPWTVTTNFTKPTTSNSFWDEGSDTAPASPIHPGSMDYTPQAIMTRDQLAKLEASVDNSPERASRNRAFSLASQTTVSSSSVASEMDELDKEQDNLPLTLGLSPPPLNKPLRRPASARASSARVLSLTTTAESLRRPLTADPVANPRNLMVHEDNTIEAPLSSAASAVTLRPLSPHEMSSLPPPPRPRLRSTTSMRSSASVTPTKASKVRSTERPGTATPSNPRPTFERPNSATPTTSSSGPALSVRTTTPGNAGSTYNGGVGIRSPSSLSARRSGGSVRSSKSKSSLVLEKAMHRKSIMRKPSFLDIEGDTDIETDGEDKNAKKEKRDSLFMGGLKKTPSAGSIPSPSAAPPRIGSTIPGESFLDFARESFDTVRS